MKAKDKRFLISFISIGLAVLLVASITFLTVFGPKKLKNILPQGDIKSVILVENRWPDYARMELSEDKIATFQETLNNLSYIKSVYKRWGSEYYLIVYQGYIVLFSDSRLWVIQDGKRVEECYFCAILPDGQYAELETLFQKQENSGG